MANPVTNYERFLYFVIACVFTAAAWPGLLWIALPTFILALVWAWER